MEENNVLSGGLDVLAQMREALVSLEEAKKKSGELATTENNLTKEIASKEKAITDEIAATIKSRQAEVEKSFDGQIDATRSRLKKSKASRDKEKNARVSERIGRETADIVEEKRKLRQDLKAVFKLDRIPRIFNTGLFFSLFLPSGPMDILKIVLAIVVIGLIPSIFVIGFPFFMRGFMAILLYIATFAIAGGIYLLIFKFVRNKHLEKLKEARAIRKQIRKSEKQADEMGKAIRNDKDESGYNLTEFDNEISQLEQQMVEISESKKAALTVFENETKLNITNDIRGRYAEELASLQESLNSIHAEHKQTDDSINAAVMEISSKYESYIGKENLRVSTIDALREIIEKGDAQTIAEALTVYNKSLMEAGVK